MRSADLNAPGQPGQDRPPRAQPLRLEPAALRLLVVSARQPQPFQRRGRTRLYENAAGFIEAAVMKRQNGRALAPAPRAQHVSHAEKRLVNDPVVIRVEWGPLFAVGQTPDVFHPD